MDIQCAICSKQFSTKRQLKYHMQYHKPKTLQCDQCPSKFAYPSQLSKHKLMHTSNASTKCTICSQIILHMNVKRHMHMVHNRPIKLANINKKELIYFCEICGQSIRDKCHLRKHKSAHESKSVQYKCDHCEYQFLTKQSMVEHMYKVHNDGRKRACYICKGEYETLKSLKEHFRIHQRPRFECPECGKLFELRKSLHDHLSRELDKELLLKYECLEEKRLCEICGVEVCHSNYKRHLKRHEKKLQCAQCGKKFSTANELKGHEWRHTGVKPFSCDVCDKGFSKKFDLNLHMKMHEGVVMKFGCDLCGKDYTTKDGMNQHKKRLHKEKTT